MPKIFAEKMLLTFFSAKNIRILCIKSVKRVNEMTLYELVKLTTLWTTGPSTICIPSVEDIVRPESTLPKSVLLDIVQWILSKIIVRTTAVHWSTLTFKVNSNRKTDSVDMYEHLMPRSACRYRQIEILDVRICQLGMGLSCCPIITESVDIVE